MKTVKLTMLQRFGLDNLLAEQKGKRENNIVYHRVRRKIKIPAFIKAEVAAKLPTMGDAVFDLYPEESFEFETEEARRVVKLGEEAELPVVALDWLEPILEQLGVR